MAGLPWIINKRGIVGLRVRETTVKRSEHMSMTACGSMEEWGREGGVTADGDDDDDAMGPCNKATFKQAKRSLTKASVTACAVPSAAGAGGAAENASNVAALSSMAKSSTSGSHNPLQSG